MAAVRRSGARQTDRGALVDLEPSRPVQPPPRPSPDAHASILTIVYHMLRDGTFYRDLGPEYFARRNPAKLAAKLANRIRNLGYHVEISAAA